MPRKVVYWGNSSEACMLNPVASSDSTEKQNSGGDFIAKQIFSSFILMLEFHGQTSA